MMVVVMKLMLALPLLLNRDGDDDHRQDPAIFSCPSCDNHENSNRMKSIERLKSFALQQ